MEISIRRAVPDDIPGMCGLLADLFSIESDFSPDTHRQTRGLALLVNDGAGSSAVFVAEDAGTIVGMCSVQALVSTAEGGPVGLVEDMIVKRRYRRRGIGKAILSEIVRWSGEKKMTRLQLLRDADNADALEFYRDNGWSHTSLVCMRKQI
ncbi:MAG: GNAT family N-acetyltransferase [Candidatus Sulfobium sp.]|jgi:GNAT superfamily N-acetyltransferase